MFALVHKSEDSCYGVSFPDVPGCFAASDKPDELAMNACAALQLHAECCELPEARSLANLLSDADVCESMADDDFIGIVYVDVTRETIEWYQA